MSPAELARFLRSVGVGDQRANRFNEAATLLESLNVAEVKAGTVRVRILVAVDDKGHWRARGSPSPNEDVIKANLMVGMRHVLRYHWIEADVPLPEAESTIAGEVKDDGP